MPAPKPQAGCKNNSSRPSRVSGLGKQGSRKEFGFWGAHGARGQLGASGLLLSCSQRASRATGGVPAWRVGSEAPFPGSPTVPLMKNSSPSLFQQPGAAFCPRSRSGRAPGAWGASLARAELSARSSCLRGHSSTRCCCCQNHSHLQLWSWGFFLTVQA